MVERERYSIWFLLAKRRVPLGLLCRNGECGWDFVGDTGKGILWGLKRGDKRGGFEEFNLGLLYDRLRGINPIFVFLWAR